MIVKSYLREELNKDIAGLDPDAEKILLQDLQHSLITSHQSQLNRLEVIFQMIARKAEGIFHGNLLNTMGERL